MFNPQQYVDKPDRFYDRTYLPQRKCSYLVGHGESRNQGLVRFQEKFSRIFVSADVEESWWTELENIKQGEGSVNELQLTLEELFTRLDVTDDKTKKRHLLKSLKPELAYEVEKEGLKGYGETMKFVKKAEMLFYKHQNFKKEDSEFSMKDSMDSLVENFKSLQVFLVNQQQQQQHPGQQPRPDQQHQYYQRQPMARFVCYNCGDEGHMSRHCPNREEGPNRKCIENSDDEVSSEGEYDTSSEGSDDSSEGDDVDSYLYPSGYSSDDESSEVESEVEDSLSGYESEDDTHYEYAYDINRLKEASPFMVTAKIGKLETEAVVDTGAATSVISKGLARKLGLKVNGDRMTIEQLDGNPSKPNGVCEQVRLRVGGKLRPEHFIVHDNKADLMLLGMTWFEAYGAVPLPQERRLVIPTRSGKDVVVQGFKHKTVTIVDTPNASKPYQVTRQEDECVKEACTKYNLRKKKKKSYFSRQEDECLGHAISTNGSLPKGLENPADALSRIEIEPFRLELYEHYNNNEDNNNNYNNDINTRKQSDRKKTGNKVYNDYNGYN
ncbi:hypothetical protein BCR42DRAFT_442906 [Absidia repens]|uniref:CCHC-type domain-containing protein n=1 Tax=Absidia repens TaxID=90262 RepID=A0A1X2I193_9FUNG|nr:hypothetical protein BCR42DRAFT_442906 [Absidia repens]